MAPADNPDERSSKRRRVAIACQPCRERKSRCDGEVPTCGTCIQIGTECFYPPPLSKTDQLRQEFSSRVEGIEDRLGGIERLLSTLEGRVSNALPITSGTPSSRVSMSLAPPLRSIETDITISEDAFQNANRSDSAADGIATVPLTSRDDCAFFGPSANISFLTCVTRALTKATRLNQNSQMEAPASGHGSPSTYDNCEVRSTTTGQSGHPTSGTGERIPHQYPMPAEQKARELLRAFFVNCSHAHPYIHEGRLMDTFVGFHRSNYASMRRSWLGLVYILFAIGSMSLPYHARVETESEMYYQLAFDICLKQVLSDGNANLETAQCLLFIALYLQGAQNSMKTWLVHGMAVKIAYQLGLHSDEASKSIDAIEREDRRRTWYGIVIMHRTLSMTTGRPVEIHSIDVTLRRPQPYVDSTQRQILEQDQSSVSYLCANVELCEIIARIVNALYGNNHGPRMPLTVDSIAKVLTLEGELQRWNSSLNPQLATLQPGTYYLESEDLNGQLSLYTRRQRTLVTLRYLNARVLIHRPILEGFLEALCSGRHDKIHLDMMRQIGANNVNMAMSSAVQQIQIIYHLVASTTRNPEQLGAWWHSLYYTFNAALAILGCLLISKQSTNGKEMLPEESQASASRALKQSLEVLDGLDEGHPTISRCRTYLQDLIRIAQPFHSANSIDLPNSDMSCSTELLNNTVGVVQPHSLLIQEQHTSLSRSSPFRQFASDMDLENFLFPLDMQMMSFEQPLT